MEEVATHSIHVDPIAPVILGVTSILLFAIIGRFTAHKLGQPTALGELLMGIQVKLETFMSWPVVIVSQKDDRAAA